jgi:molybdate transport system substrate-binding protein
VDIVYKLIFNRYSISLLLTSSCLFTIMPVYADTLNIAVASNFTHTLKVLSAEFEKQSGHQSRISSASTGQLYTQIQHGAPFDVFLAADEKRPDLLLAEDRALLSSGYVYASGRLVLLSNISPADSCYKVLTLPALQRLAIANPKTAPYGGAAMQVLKKMGLWQALQPRLVMGENIAQTLQFVTTKNAQAGFVAKSMLSMGKNIDTACTWDVPANMYSPIRQKMVVLKRAVDKAAALEFLQYIKSVQAKEIISAAGYDVI